MRFSGFVLKEEISNQNKIISFYSKEQGVLYISVQGALRPKSKLAALCLPFKYLELTVVKGKTSYHLIGGRAKEIYWSIWHSWQKMLISRSIMDDLEKLAGQGGDAGIINLLQQTFREINKSENKYLMPLLYSFELKLLDKTGYRPDFNLLKAGTREKKILKILLKKDYKDIKKYSFLKQDLISAGRILRDFINWQI